MSALDGLAALSRALEALGYQPAPYGEDGLEIQVSGDEPPATRPMRLRLATLQEGAASAASLLTFSLTYEFGAPEGGIDAIRLAGSVIDRYLLLGHVVVSDQGEVGLRYAMLLDRELSPEVLVQLMGVLDYQQLHYGDYLEAICTDEVDLDIFPAFVARAEVEIDFD
jgi:hypothetical protein